MGENRQLRCTLNYAIRRFFESTYIRLVLFAHVWGVWGTLWLATKWIFWLVWRTAQNLINAIVGRTLYIANYPRSDIVVDDVPNFVHLEAERHDPLGLPIGGHLAHTVYQSFC